MKMCQRNEKQARPAETPEEREENAQFLDVFGYWGGSFERVLYLLCIIQQIVIHNTKITGKKRKNQTKHLNREIQRKKLKEKN